MIALISVLGLFVGSATANVAIKTVSIPMRDGVRLSTDLHLSEYPKGPKPAVLIRTPYDKATYREMADNSSSATTTITPTRS